MRDRIRQSMSMCSRGERGREEEEKKKKIVMEDLLSWKILLWKLWLDLILLRVTEGGQSIAR